MKKLIVKDKLYFYLLFSCFLTSLLIDYFIFNKSAPNFPVVLRTNDFGTHFLANRYAIWQVSFVGGILVLLNGLLSRLLKKTKPNLSFFLIFVNMGIAILTLVINLQIYFLNI